MKNLQSARVAKISYRLDVGRTDGETITLGMLALFSAPDEELLVLVSRAKLDDAERAKMDWIAVQMLADPATFFMQEIDQAHKTNVPDLFAHLSQKFAWSIYIAPAANVPIPQELSQDLCQALDKLTAQKGNQSARRPRKNRRAEVIEVRPPNPAAAALARITGPEFPSDDLIALLPPPWMINGSFTAVPAH